MCGFLFSLHPIHTEAVAGIVGRADITACIFYIISFLSYVKHVRFRVILTNYRSCYKYSNVNCKYLVHLTSSEEKSCGYLWFQCAAWLVLCLVASACAMLSKESGLTVLVVCGIYDIVTNCRSVKHFFTKVSLIIIEFSFSKKKNWLDDFPLSYKIKKLPQIILLLKIPLNIP